MNKIKLVLKYVLPYKGAIITNVLFNLLSAICALLSYTVIVPFLRVLFNMVEPTPDPGPFQMNFDYLSDWFTYQLGAFIQNHGQLYALLIVCS
ncbi:MAG: hypothetical protein J6W61_02180, partial [Bacteroidales bacterium]|nr:hypothetical protein [Bacteroidales bacterium]